MFGNFSILLALTFPDEVFAIDSLAVLVWWGFMFELLLLLLLLLLFSGTLCFSITFTGTLTITFWPFGNSISTGTDVFSPGVSVFGISPTFVIFHPSGRSTCFLTSFSVIGVPTSTTIGVTFGVTITGTSTVTFLPSGNSISTVTEGLFPGVVVVGISPTFVIFHPSGRSTCFFTSSCVIGVPTLTTIGVVFGVTITGTFTVTRFPPGNSITTGILGLSPGTSVEGLSPILMTLPPSGILTCFSTSSLVIGSPSFLTISFIGVTFTGTSTSICFPFGSSILTLTVPLSPGVFTLGISPTPIIFPPSGTLTCFSISSLVKGVSVTGVSIPVAGVTFTGTSTVITFPFGNSTVTLTGSFLPGIVKSGMFSTFVTFPPSGIVIPLV